MTTLLRKPIEAIVAEPAIDRDTSSQRPMETRYGWCPFDRINLIGPDGTPTYVVQPYQIESLNGNIVNPRFRELRKNDLIPFPTFNTVTNAPSPDLTDSNGRAVLIPGVRTIAAVEAATTILRAYSRWGFVILNSLQGIDQPDAWRIFKVVQPLDYLLFELETELTFGAEERIDATGPIRFGDDYSVEPLRSDSERETARKLAGEMADGAGVAFTLATTILDDTEASMTQRFAGGQGKTGPDPLDIRLCLELNRKLPKLIGAEKDSGLGEIKEQIAFLTQREMSRADKEEIAALKAKIAQMESGEPAVIREPVAVATCGAPKTDGTPCMRNVKPGEMCAMHREQAEAAAKAEAARVAATATE